MFYTRLVAMLATAAFMGIFTGTSVADDKSSRVNLPALKIISPVSGATVENPVLLTKVTTNQYQYSLGKTKPGKHTIRVYWDDATHMKAISKMVTVNVTVK